MATKSTKKPIASNTSQASPVSWIRRHRWLVIALSVIVVLLLGSVCAYGGYMFSLVSGKPASLTFEQDTSFNHYHYKIVQQPGVLVSGQPATFTVTVTSSQTGKPIVDRNFDAGVGHSSGLFIDSRQSDQTNGTYTSDASGTFVVSYTSHFFDLMPDEGFVFGPGLKTLTSAEQDAY